jgi:hypothetical protein
MLTKEQALEKVTHKINEPDPYWPDKPKIVVMDEHTIEKEWGWVFFYESSDYLQTGGFSNRLAGNAPYIVNKATGELVETGTALPTEDYIKKFEQQIGKNV